MQDLLGQKKALDNVKSEGNLFANKNLATFTINDVSVKNLNSQISNVKNKMRKSTSKLRQLPELPSAISKALVPLSLHQLKKQNSDSTFSTINFDFQRRNILNIKAKSGANLNTVKSKIGKQMASTRRTLADSAQNNMLSLPNRQNPSFFKMKSIYESLQIELRNFFSKKRPFLQLFEIINQAYFSFQQVIHTVSCYRIELGNTLSSILQNFNFILKRILDLTYKNDIEKQKFVEKKIIECQNVVQKIQYAKVETDKRVKLLQRIIKTKDNEIINIKTSEDALQHQVRNLREILRNQVLASELEQKRKQARIERRKQAQSSNAEQSQKLFDGLTKTDDQKLTKNIQDLLEQIRMMETEKDKRKAIIQDMAKLLKSLMKQGKQDAETQVQDGELLWQPKNYISLQIVSQTQSNLKSFQPSVDKLKYESPNKNNHPIVDYLRNQDIQSSQQNNPQNDNKKQQANFLTAASGAPINAGLLQKESRSIAQNWNIPIFMVAFIANSLQQQEMG